MFVYERKYMCVVCVWMCFLDRYLLLFKLNF